MKQLNENIEIQFLAAIVEDSKQLEQVVNYYIERGLGIGHLESNLVDTANTLKDEGWQYLFNLSKVEGLTFMELLDFITYGFIVGVDTSQELKDQKGTLKLYFDLDHATVDTIRDIDDIWLIAEQFYAEFIDYDQAEEIFNKIKDRGYITFQELDKYLLEVEKTKGVEK